MDSCAFDKLFEKSVPHILEKIFLSLDYESYKTCLKVSRIWTELLMSESYLSIGKSVFHDDISKDQERLFNATKKGDVTEVRRLLSRSRMLLDVNNTSEPWSEFYKVTPLHVAARRGHKVVVKLLLDGGGDPNRADWDGFTPLHNAANGGHNEVVKLLLERGADGNKQTKFGRTRTPLHWAAKHGYKEIVQTLLDKGAKPNKTDNDGKTPISLAHQQGHMDIVKILKIFASTK